MDELADKLGERYITHTAEAYIAHSGNMTSQKPIISGKEFFDKYQLMRE